MKIYQMEVMTKKFRNVVKTVVEARRRNSVTLRRGGGVPQQCYWVFHLGVPGDVVQTYWWDVVDTYHCNVLVKHHWDVVACLIWDLFETSWRRNDGTSSQCPFGRLSQHSNKTSWRRTTETSWQRSSETLLEFSFGTSLGRTESRRYDVATTSCCRVGIVLIIFSYISPSVINR